MVNRIAARPASDWHRYSIVHPDRGSAPFAFHRADFGELARELAR